MRLFRCLCASLYIFFLDTTVLSKPFLKYLSTLKPLLSHIHKRQVSGVVGTAQFLRRAYQASTVVDNWIYIDGGEFSFLNNGTPNYVYSNTILSIDLSLSWTNSTVRIQSTAKPSNCPSLNGPSLWYNQEESVFYTGFAGWLPNFRNDDATMDPSIWTFEPDGTGSGAWNEIISSGASALRSLNRPEQAYQAFGGDSAWVLGGFDQYDPGQYPYTASMVHFNMSSRTFANLSTPTSLANSGAMDNGAMHYVPSFGPQGLFVVLGGDTIQKPEGLISFDTVAVFDPVKQEWWNQTTTGSPPTSRIEFCTAGINSTNGTYEIFVYGGWGTVIGAASVQYDTISILTLPAFHWISVPNDPQNSRVGLSCNVVGGSQVLTIGGHDTNPKQFGDRTDREIIENSYNNPDPNAQGLAIFDMTNLTWSSQYTADAPQYEQSSPIKQFYAQAQQTYNQNLTAGLAELLKVTHFADTSAPSSAPPAPTSPPSSHSTSVGGIAGGTVGGIVVLGLVVGTIVLYFKRRSRSEQPNDPADSQEAKYDANPEQQEIYPHEMDQESGRPPELPERLLFEVEDRPRAELAASGTNQYPEYNNNVST